MMRFVIVDGESCGVFVFFDEVVGKVGRKISPASLRSAAVWAGVGHRMLFCTPLHPCTLKKKGADDAVGDIGSEGW